MKRDWKQCYLEHEDITSATKRPVFRSILGPKTSG